MSKTTITIELKHQIPPCEGKPTPQWVHQAYQICQENALSYNDKHDYGYLRLTCDAAEYQRITGQATDFTAPTRPAEPDYNGENSQLALLKLRETYELQLKEFTQYNEVDRLMAQQLRGSLDPAFINSLKGDLGWHGVRTKAILDHLKDNHGKISPKDLIANEARIQTQYTARTPIELFWKQHEDGKEYTKGATRGEITDDRLIVFATTNLMNTDLPAFKEAIRKYDKLPADQQTWNKFKEMMNEAYADLPASDKEPLTTQAGGYANAAEDKENSLPEPPYCWSHGTSRNVNHTSLTCKRKLPGHVDTATFWNMCGGCNRIQRRRNEKPVWKPVPRNNSTSEPDV